MTESQERFARRAVRRKRLFLGLSAAGLAGSAVLGVIFGLRWWHDPAYPIAPRMVILLLVLLNARQNLRQFKYAVVLETLIPPGPTQR